MGKIIVLCQSKEVFSDLNTGGNLLRHCTLQIDYKITMLYPRHLHLFLDEMFLFEVSNMYDVIGLLMCTLEDERRRT